MTAYAVTVSKELTLFTWPNCWDCICMNNEMAYLHATIVQYSLHRLQQVFESNKCVFKEMSYRL